VVMRHEGSPRGRTQRRRTGRPGMFRVCIDWVTSGPCILGHFIAKVHGHEACLNRPPTALRLAEYQPSLGQGVPGAAGCYGGQRE